MKKNTDTIFNNLKEDISVKIIWWLKLTKCCRWKTNQFINEYFWI